MKQWVALRIGLQRLHGVVQLGGGVGILAEESLDDLIALAKAQGAPDNVTAVLIEHE